MYLCINVSMYLCIYVFAVRRRTNTHVEVTQGGKAVLGVGLRKRCPQDSFGYAFREKKAVRKSTPGGCKTGPRGVQNGLREASGRLFCASWAQLPARAVRKPCLGGSGGALGALLAARGAVLKPLGLLFGLSRAAPGRSWGWFWDLPGADLDVLGDVCGAT